MSELLWFVNIKSQVTLHMKSNTEKMSWFLTLFQQVNGEPDRQMDENFFRRVQ